MLPYEKVKLVIVGDSGVGKTTVLHHLLQKNSVQPTITLGVDLYVHTHTIYETSVKFQLWDTTGMEGLRSLVLQRLKGTDGTILVHDARKPLEPYLEKWIPSIRAHTDTPIFLFHSNTEEPTTAEETDSYIDMGIEYKHTTNVLFNSLYYKIKDSRGF
jgi:Rab-like protein 3